MPKTHRDQVKREKLLYAYTNALDIGDFETLASVLAQAENDPTLERMILELNDELERETTYVHANNNHKGQSTMTVISGGMERTAPRKRQSKLTGAVVLVAGMLVVLFGAYLLLYKNGDGQVSSSAIRIQDTSTPTRYNIATAFRIEQTQTWEALSPADKTATRVSARLTATAFWDMHTATSQVFLGTSTPGPTNTPIELNVSQQTATAFWDMQTQQPGRDLTAIAPTVTPPLATVSPPVELVFPSEGGLQYPDFDRLFRGINGTFVMYDPQNDVTVIYNPERAQQRFAPHSTFKILNAAISLETGAMPDEDFMIEWDQEQYPLTEFPETSPYNEWRQNQNLRTGMQYSVVWFYTEVARLIGEEQMAEWVEVVGYGNMDTSAWIDDVQFWLGGSLEITAIEQTQFLWRFYDGQLGFSDRTTDIVKDLIVLEETETYRLSAKTGTGTDGMAWLVGYLERGDEVYIFALNLNLQGTDRMALTREIFMEMGLIQ